MPQLKTFQTKYIVVKDIDEQIRRIAKKEIPEFDEHLKINFVINEFTNEKVNMQTRIEYSPTDHYPIFVCFTIELLHDRMISTNEKEKIRKELYALSRKTMNLNSPFHLKELIKKNKIHFPRDKELKYIISNLRNDNRFLKYNIHRLETRVNEMNNRIMSVALATI